MKIERGSQFAAPLKKRKGSEMSSRTKFVLGLVVFTIAVRLVPYLLEKYNAHTDPTAIYYPWNFVPLMSVSLFCGAYVADRRLALALPFAAQFIHQLAFLFLTGKVEWAFQKDCWSLYLCYALAVFLGQGLGSRQWPMRGAHAVSRGLFCELVFFLITNFTYFQVQIELPHTFDGLMTCYIQAIPFAIKAFLGTGFYALLLFSPLAINLMEEHSVSPVASPVK